jgi:LysR family hydrogen peroxide-inducible transcriptional activator
VPETHPLAKKHALVLEDLAEQKLLLLEDGHCLRDQALDVCQLAGASEKSEFQATSLETLRQMVAANVGVTLLPTLAVKPPVARSENIRLLPFRGAQPSRQIAMAWRKSSALDDFLAQLAKVFRELPGELFTPTPDLPPAAQPGPRRSGRDPSAARR